MSLIKDTACYPYIPRFFDDFFTRKSYHSGNLDRYITNTTVPSVNIIENNEAFIAEMAAPGMSKRDFQIELDNEALVISSQKHRDEETKTDSNYIRREFSFQSFQRAFHLPKSVVDISKINAKYENGILRVLIPKREEAKTMPPRKIKIS
jgi:HSP20 family protein